MEGGISPSIDPQNVLLFLTTLLCWRGAVSVNVIARADAFSSDTVHDLQPSRCVFCWRYWHDVQFTVTSFFFKQMDLFKFCARYQTECIFSLFRLACLIVMCMLNFTVWDENLYIMCVCVCVWFTTEEKEDAREGGLRSSEAACLRCIGLT